MHVYVRLCISCHEYSNHWLVAASVHHASQAAGWHCVHQPIVLPHSVALASGCLWNLTGFEDPSIRKMTVCLSVISFTLYQLLLEEASLNPRSAVCIMFSQDSHL